MSDAFQEDLCKELEAEALKQQAVDRATLAQADKALASLNRELDTAKQLLRECADDLACYIEHEYAATHEYPSQKRRYERDMELPRQAYKFLGIEDDGK